MDTQRNPKPTPGGSFEASFPNFFAPMPIDTDAVPQARMPVDIVEDSTGFTVCADIPGAGADEIRVRVEGRTLHIDVTPAGAGDPAASPAILLRHERYRGAMSKTVELPRRAAGHAFDLAYSDGVLTLRFAK